MCGGPFSSSPQIIKKPQPLAVTLTVTTPRRSSRVGPERQVLCVSVQLVLVDQRGLPGEYPHTRGSAPRWPRRCNLQYEPDAEGESVQSAQQRCQLPVLRPDGCRRGVLRQVPELPRLHKFLRPAKSPSAVQTKMGIVGSIQTIARTTESRGCARRHVAAAAVAAVVVAILEGQETALMRMSTAATIRSIATLRMSKQCARRHAGSAHLAPTPMATASGTRTTTTAERRMCLPSASALVANAGELQAV